MIRVKTVIHVTKFVINLTLSIACKLYIAYLSARDR